MPILITSKLDIFRFPKSYISKLDVFRFPKVVHFLTCCFPISKVVFFRTLHFSISKCVLSIQMYHVTRRFTSMSVCACALDFCPRCFCAKSMIMMMLLFVCLIYFLAFPLCVLGESTTDVLIYCYFRLGYEYRLILCFLYFIHGITLSLRQLKRILRRLGLRRRASQDRGLLLDTLRVIEVG